MIRTYSIAAVFAAAALPAAAQTAPNSVEAKAQADVSRTDAQQAGQKVVPARKPADPANDIKQMGPAAGAAMNARDTGRGSMDALPGVPGVVVGKMVEDTGGNRVGTIEAVEGDLAVVATSKAKVRVPRSSFADRNGVLVIAMTEQQLNDAAGRPANGAATNN
ncbi:MAG: hypothetical protein RQ833_02255 [Sphingomonadaceae bacterium]|nr:hypothetical protein [Sphingomonadaceae bacterium]